MRELFIEFLYIDIFLILSVLYLLLLYHYFLVLHPIFQNFKKLIIIAISKNNANPSHPYPKKSLHHRHPITQNLRSHNNRTPRKQHRQTPRQAISISYQTFHTYDIIVTHFNVSQFIAAVFGDGGEDDCGC